MAQPNRPENDDCGHLGKGYQPTERPQPSREPTPQGGYQPESQGDNPANAPPGAE